MHTVTVPSTLTSLAKTSPETDASELLVAMLTMFRNELPLGWAALEATSAELAQAREPRMIERPLLHDPTTWRQVIQLIGTDAARRACESRLECRFALYQPGVVVVAKDREALNLTTRIQSVHLKEERDWVPPAEAAESAIEFALLRWASVTYPLGWVLLQNLIGAARTCGRGAGYFDPNTVDGIEIANILGGMPALRPVIARKGRVNIEFFLPCHVIITTEIPESVLTSNAAPPSPTLRKKDRLPALLRRQITLAQTPTSA